MNLFRKKLVWLAGLVVLTAGFYAYFTATLPKPAAVTVAPTLPKQTDATSAETAEISEDGFEVFEKPPVFIEPAPDKMLAALTQPPYKYVLAGVVGVLTLIGLLILRPNAKGKRKTKLVPNWSDRKIAALSVFLAVAGGFVVWQTLAAAPRNLFSSWAGYVPIRAADYGSGITGGAFNGSIAKWNNLARKTIITGSTNSPMIRFRPGGSDSSLTYRYGNVCDIYLNPSHRNNVLAISHELGHCLGFIDHVRAYEWNAYRTRGITPPVCDDARHSYYHNYTGIMSYCTVFSRPSAVFGSDDLAGLRANGYIGGSSSGGNPGSGTSDPCRTVGSNSAGSLNPYSSGNHPSLRQGMSNTCVRHAQWYLMRFYTFTRDIRPDVCGPNRNEDCKESRYHPGTIDGKFDSKVTAAVKYYQEKRRISQTGLIDGQTWKLLHQTCAGLKDGGGARYCYYR